MKAEDNLTITDDAIFEARARILAAVISTFPNELIVDIKGNPSPSIIKLADEYMEEFLRKYL